jgi:curved DNA-binding protein
MGVERDASPDDIKRAYRRLARKYHPDVSKEAQAEARFKEIGEAYEVLRDPEKRAAYDALGTRRPGEEFRPPPDWGFDVGGETTGMHSDFFEQLFGHGAPRGFAGSFVTTAEIELTLEEAYGGTEKRIALDGLAADEHGRLRRSTRQVTVRIPAGAVDGQRVRIPAAAQGGEPSGDLLLAIRLRPHRWFRAEGRDIHLDLPVTPWEAALGETVRVPTLGGRVDLRLPKGSQSGQQLRLRGRGLPGNPPGDQLVALKVVVPPPRGPAEEALYRQLAAAHPSNPRAEMEDTR